MTTDAWRAVSELAASQHGCFSTTQAAVPHSTIKSWRRSGRIVTPWTGVHHIVGAPLTWMSRLTAITLAHPSAVASHRAAGQLHRLEGVDGDWVELTLPRSRYQRLKGVVVHVTDTLHRDDVITIDGIRATTLARTAADLGAVLDDVAVARVAEDVARRSSSLWLDQVLERVDRPGPSGTGALRRSLGAVPDLGVPASWFERLVVEALRGAGLPVVSQYELRTEAGRFVARFDAAIPEVRLGIEAHSRRWHYGPRANVRDADRDARVSAEDWDVLYVRYGEAQSAATVVAKVLPVVEARRRRIG